MSFPEKLDTLRRISKSSISSLSKRTGVSRTALTNFFSNETSLGSSKLGSVLKQFEIDLDSIIQKRIDEKTGKQNEKCEEELKDTLASVFNSLSSLEKGTIIETLESYDKTSKHPDFKNKVENLKSIVIKKGY